MNQDELKHYGVLGMRWGVRRAVGPDGRVANRAAKAEDDAIKKQRRDDVKNRRRLSDKDLTEKIGRLEKEKKLRELTEAEIDAGKKATNDILKSAGTKVATTILSGAALYGLKAFLTGKVDITDLAGYVTPKPGKK